MVREEINQGAKKASRKTVEQLHKNKWKAYPIYFNTFISKIEKSILTHDDKWDPTIVENSLPVARAGGREQEWV